MKGTEKQIKWAEDIMNTAKMHLENMICCLNEEEEKTNKDMYRDAKQAAMITLDWVKKLEAQTDDASVIINHRSMMAKSSLNARINRVIIKIATSKHSMEMLDVSCLYF